MTQTYKELKQEWTRVLLSRFDGHELLNLAEVARVYGYRDPQKVCAEIASIPAYPVGEKKTKCKYAVKDIAADLARRARMPEGA